MGTSSTLAVDPAVLLGQLALRLAAVSPRAAWLPAVPDRPAAPDLAGALELLVSGCGLRSAVLRGPATGPAPLLAVAGEVLHAVPAMRGDLPLAAVDLPVPGDRAVLTVVGARPSQLPALRAAAAVLGLALTAPEPAPAVDAAALLLDADEDGDRLADRLHDGPVQALVAARYACDTAVRAAGGSAPAALARDAVQEALVGLRQTMWHLRSRASLDLPDALAALSVRLVEAGAPPLETALDPDAAARLAPAARALVYRLVQAVAGPGAPPVRVVLRPERGEVVVDVVGGAPLAGPDRWAARLRAVDGSLTSSTGAVRLHLPGTPAAPVPSLSQTTEACS